MTTVRQPANVNPQNQVGWKLLLHRAPNLEFFCIEFSPPGIQIGTAKQYTPLDDIPWAGDRIYRDMLRLRFMVAEDWSNYDELYTWMVNLTRPELATQYANLTRESAFSGRGVKSDVSVFVSTSKRNPTVEWRFLDAFPVSLSVSRFNFQDRDVQYVTGEVSFAYRHFHLNRPE
jgi:hypothetical protein